MVRGRSDRGTPAPEQSMDLHAQYVVSELCCGNWRDIFPATNTFLLHDECIRSLYSHVCTDLADLVIIYTVLDFGFDLNYIFIGGLAVVEGSL